MAPLVTSAASAICSSDVAAYPRSRNSRCASASSRCRVRSFDSALVTLATASCSLIDIPAANQYRRNSDTDGMRSRERRMSVGEQVMSRAVEPTLLRVCQWRGDPVARLMLPETRTDPYPLYARVRQRGLVRRPLGAFIAADHATVAAVLRDRRFSSSPTHQRGYRPPSYPPDDPPGGLPAG